MRGAWRPLAAYGGASVALLVPIALGARRADPRALLAVGGMLLLVSVWLATRALAPPASFLAGLRDAGLALDVVSDEVNWNGDRVLVAREGRGEWRIRAANGRSVALLVTAPGESRSRRVVGPPRRAGARALDPAEPRDLAEPASRPVRVALAVALVAIALALALASNGPLGVGAGAFAAFLAFVAAGSFSLRAAPPRSRREAARVLLLALAAGLAVSHLGRLRDETTARLVVGSACAILTALASRAHGRGTLTLGAFAALVSASTLASIPVALVAAAISALAAFQTWTRAPPTPGDSGRDPREA